MEEKEFNEFCDRAIRVWGEEAQIRMCIEEMSELTKELCKYIRVQKDNKPLDEDKLNKTKQNIIEETADVINCVKQMARMFGEEEVEKVREFKVQRATKYLDRDEKMGE